MQIALVLHAFCKNSSLQAQLPTHPFGLPSWRCRTAPPTDPAVWLNQLAQPYGLVGWRSCMAQLASPAERGEGQVS